MTLKERCLFLRIVENILNGKIIFPIKKKTTMLTAFVLFLYAARNKPV